MTLSRDERVGLVEWKDKELPITEQSSLLGLGRSGLYYKPVSESAGEIAIKHGIDEIYTESPFYGSRRITASLIREGIVVNRKQVQRHMREMGIEGIAPKPSLSLAGKGHKVFPYLLRGLRIERVNQVWGIDITYIRLSSGWMYLVAIIDWHSRYVMSWELDQSLELPFVLAATSKALNKATPDILNSDQGSQFTSQAYISLLEGAGTQISMDGRGRAFDNIFTERLWRTVKYEDVYIKGYSTPGETRIGIRNYFEFYNNKRLHQSLGYQTPAEVHFSDRIDE